MSKCTKYTWISHVQRNPLQSTQKLILLYLFARMSDDGSDCYPSQATIAKHTGLHEKTVQRHLSILESSGWVRVEIRGVNGHGHKRQQYWPNVPAENGDDKVTSPQRIPNVPAEDSKRPRAERYEVSSEVSIEVTNKNKGQNLSSPTSGDVSSFVKQNGFKAYIKKSQEAAA
jgi:DNA-binding transcriptional MocR family regulator